VLAEKGQEPNKPGDATASASARYEIVILLGVEVCGESYLAEIAATDDIVGSFFGGLEGWHDYREEHGDYCYYDQQFY